MILTLCVGMAACSDGKTKRTDDNEQTKRNVVEVVLFHGAQSCASCKAIERTTLRSVEEYHLHHVSFCLLIVIRSLCLAIRASRHTHT